ncbi:protein ALTERED PHOSPHATE STARVATION RESPONSE 1-like [Primulina tabacum]|uniref:protein ALTERED PHOSPHATE STARVATION RESPONSE 1-like n=1 Tax=Primulina tabacum TaxID=48773 RepID=UPI003F59D3E2
MGCVASRIDREERVKICRERKRLMKQLLGCRKEFADALLVYLRSLKNTGATLRQFTESESLELEENTSDFAFPPSPPAPPPPPLPPAPPPPPPFSPDLRKLKNKHPKAHSAVEEEIIEIEEDKNHTPPPLPTGSSWDYWDPFGPSSPQCDKQSEAMEQEDENWAETNTEFIDEDEEAAFDATKEIDLIPVKQQRVELAGENSSMMSWHAKDTADMGMVVWRNNKTLSSIVKDLDEYFLKASGSVKNIAVVIDINTSDSFRYNGIKENKRKRSNSTRVFRALTWSWSLKSLQSSREAELFSEPNEPCKPGAHCTTLQKLYSEEQKLHKDVKEEVNAKVEFGRKSLLLQRQEEDHDWVKAEKTRLTVESLESYILSTQESINGSYSTISKLINEELHPQIVALASGLMHMWHTMHKCHQVQSHISQQLIHLADQQYIEPTSEYHLQAAAQLHTEVTSWYNSFCKLVKFQREYVGTLKKWTELTSCLANIGTPQSDNSLKLDALLGEWLNQLNNLHDKIVSETIKGLISAVETIVLKQQEEYNMRKRSEKLGRKLERELNSLSEVEFRFEGSFSLGEVNSVTTSKHPLLSRRAKVEALKTLADEQKAKYVNCVKATQALILNNLQTRLPNVFRVLTDYSKAYVHCFEAILGGQIALEQ